MESAQAALLGFPNPIIGVAAFPVIVATGAALLAGGRLAQWYWLGLQAGVTMAFAFICWLVFQSLYRIGALCPYCMVVWAVVIPLFWYVTARNVAAGALGAGPDGGSRTACATGAGRWCSAPTWWSCCWSSSASGPTGRRCSEDRGSAWIQLQGCRSS